SHGIAYVWRKDLGGWRKPKAGSPQAALESAGVRGLRRPHGGRGVRTRPSWLMETSAVTPTAIICAESLWWRCHRRMIADALMARGVEVLHLMPGGRQEPDRLHPAARLEGRRIVYD